MSFRLDVLGPAIRDLPRSPPRPRHSGVYFLIYGDDVVYVGQSSDIEQRAANQWARRRHRNRRHRLVFDRIVWIPLAVEDLDAYEGYFIRRLTPRYNTTVPGGEERDAEIALLFPLPDPTDIQRADFDKRRHRAFNVAQRRWRRLSKRWAKERDLIARLQDGAA